MIPEDKKILDQVMALLSPIGGVHSRAMFGGFGIFHDDAMFALIKGPGLFFKVNSANRPQYEKAGSKQFNPMPYFQVPAEVVTDAAMLRDWARTSIQIAHSSPKKKSNGKDSKNREEIQHF